jgi:nucleoside-diphosphate-sugar epimerase
MKFEFEDVFITGSNGWLGRQIVESLIHNDPDVLEMEKSNSLTINCLINETENGSFFKKYSKKVKLLKGDLRKHETIKNFIYKSNKGLLIHTAGVIHPKNIKDFYDINYIATSKLIEQAINANINKIIVISSNSPIGCNPSSKHTFNEKSNYNPYMNYGKSKELMEKFLLSKINDGIDITIIRPPWFYGENMPQRQIVFYKMVISGKFPIIGDGLNVRSLANVKNICQGIFLASVKKISKGKIYWIADENNLNMLEIIGIIKKVFKNEFNMKTRKNFIKIPYFFGQIFELMDFFLQKIGIYSQKIHVLSELNKNIACDISLAKKELNYKPKIDLYDGTYKAYFEYLKLNQ